MLQCGVCSQRACSSCYVAQLRKKNRCIPVREYEQSAPVLELVLVIYIVKNCIIANPYGSRTKSVPYGTAGPSRFFFLA